MLELLISILMSLGIQFTMLDDKVAITSKDMTALEASPEYRESGAAKAADAIIIQDGVDPAATK